MNKIASFTVNHDKLDKGMYLSRTDGDIITYDIRMKKPNGGDYLGNGALHTFEHLFATYARNSALSDNVIYVGPMGCRTGFYFLVRNNISHTQAIALVKESFKPELFTPSPGNRLNTGKTLIKSKNGLSPKR